MAQADLAFAITPESLGPQACTDKPKLCFQSSQWCKDKWEGYEGPSELALGQVQTYWRFSHITASSVMGEGHRENLDKSCDRKGLMGGAKWIMVQHLPRTQGSYLNLLLNPSDCTLSGSCTPWIGFSSFSVLCLAPLCSSGKCSTKITFSMQTSMLLMRQFESHES